MRYETVRVRMCVSRRSSSVQRSREECRDAALNAPGTFPSRFSYTVLLLQQMLLRERRRRLRALQQKMREKRIDANTNRPFRA